ncbi:hypothetical protein RIF29_18277 [Crotalaria pallida]|uniref:Uncharacterized protein n=1 Tax=Crotalaria pallida TaxID=3830 RepID=A0AAN9FIN3_CROPI
MRPCYADGKRRAEEERSSNQVGRNTSEVRRKEVKDKKIQEMETNTNVWRRLGGRVEKVWARVVDQGKDGANKASNKRESFQEEEQRWASRNPRPYVMQRGWFPRSRYKKSMNQFRKEEYKITSGLEYVPIEDKVWLAKCYVGDLHGFDVIDEIQNLILAEGLIHIRAVRMGGRRFLLYSTDEILEERPSGSSKELKSPKPSRYDTGSEDESQSSGAGSIDRWMVEYQKDLFEGEEDDDVVAWVNGENSNEAIKSANDEENKEWEYVENRKSQESSKNEVGGWVGYTKQMENRTGSIKLGSGSHEGVNDDCCDVDSGLAQNLKLKEQMGLEWFVDISNSCRKTIEENGLKSNEEGPISFNSVDEKSDGLVTPAVDKHLSVNTDSSPNEKTDLVGSFVKETPAWENAVKSALTADANISDKENEVYQMREEVLTQSKKEKALEMAMVCSAGGDIKKKATDATGKNRKRQGKQRRRRVHVTEEVIHGSKSGSQLQCELISGNPAPDAKLIWEMGKELGVLSCEGDEVMIRRLTQMELKDMGLEKHSEGRTEDVGRDDSKEEGDLQAVRRVSG